MSTLWTLVRKDLSLQWRACLACALLSTTGAAIALAAPPFAGVGLSLLLAAIIGASFHFPIVTVLREEMGRTRAWVLSLPVTPADYVVSKLLANAALFTLSVGAAVALLLVAPEERRILPVPALALFAVGFLVWFLRTIGLALATGSMAWTMAFHSIDLALVSNGASYLASHIPAVRGFFFEVMGGGPAFLWSLVALALQLAIIVVAARAIYLRRRAYA